jgi:stress-induced morphogen
MSQAIADQMHGAITAAIPDADVEVTIGSPGHYALVVRSGVFEGLRLVEKQRLVYRAIKDLMAGDEAPVHAIDSLRTDPLAR